MLNSFAFFILVEVLLRSLVIKTSTVFEIVETILPLCFSINFSRSLSLTPVKATFLPINLGSKCGNDIDNVSTGTLTLE